MVQTVPTSEAQGSTETPYPQGLAAEDVRAAFSMIVDKVRQVDEAAVPGVVSHVTRVLQDLIVSLNREKSNIALPVNETRSAPLKAVMRVFQRWLLSDTEQAHILGYASPHAGWRDGYDVMTRDIRDRIALVLDIYEGVYTLLKDANAERAWIATPRADLGDVSILDLMTEGSQRNLIRAQAYVDHVNGR